MDLFGEGGDNLLWYNVGLNVLMIQLQGLLTVTRRPTRLILSPTSRKGRCIIIRCIIIMRLGRQTSGR